MALPHRFAVFVGAVLVASVAAAQSKLIQTTTTERGTEMVVTEVPGPTHQVKGEAHIWHVGDDWYQIQVADTAITVHTAVPLIQHDGTRAWDKTAFSNAEAWFGAEWGVWLVATMEDGQKLAMSFAYFASPVPTVPSALSNEKLWIDEIGEFEPGTASELGSEVDREAVEAAR